MALVGEKLDNIVCERQDDNTVRVTLQMGGKATHFTLSDVKSDSVEVFPDGIRIKTTEGASIAMVITALVNFHF